ncbi:MAG: hypoxanthine phosphoribosyltransferase [bacterium]|jgi:hypoxanthine phosphoribosyltransferase|nr:hypoxanthine phosphoribosyltransferase [bacterium]
MSLPIQKILIPQEEIQSRVWQLAQEINQHYQGESLVLLSVLKGSVVFLVDLMRELDLDVEIGFMVLSSYHGGTSPQDKIQHYTIPCPPLAGRHVLLVEDILDTGGSLAYALTWCAQQQPKSLKTCVLLIKEGIPRPDIQTDYLGFRIPNEFVVGYGLDYQERYRHLPFIGVPQF